MKNVKYLICLILIANISCNSKTEYRYYSSGEIAEKRVYVQKKDTSTYLLTQYYPNKQIKNQGNVINNKKEGIWNEWYADGSILWTGEWECDDKHRKRVKPTGSTKILLSDSLELNKPVYLRISIEGVHRADLTIGVTNATALRIDDDKSDLYDFKIVPKYLGIIKIYQFIYYGDFQEETRIDTLYIN